MSQREIATELGYGPNSFSPAVTEARRAGLIGVRHVFRGTELAVIRDSLIEGMWADGWLAREIAEVVDLSIPSVRQAVTRLRLPYRYAGYSKRYEEAA